MVRLPTSTPLERAKAAGAYLGGKRRLDRERIKALHGAGTSLAAIARALGCSRMQVYRVLQEAASVLEGV